MSEPWCAAASLGAREPLAGTALDQVRGWIGLELGGVWPKKAPDHPAFSPAVAHALRSLGKGHQVHLLRPEEDGPMRVWWADTHAGTVHRFTPDSDAALLAALADGPPPDAEPVAGPVVWVCTHGKRDRCCAKYGVAFHTALADVASFPIARSSHLGGHRFAATAVVLPSGAQYGHLAPEDAERFARDVEAGRLWLEHLRGDTRRSPAHQAAEIAVRRHTGDVARPATVTGDGSLVRVSLGGRDFEVDVQETAGPLIPKSCGVEAAPVPVLEARLRG